MQPMIIGKILLQTLHSLLWYYCIVELSPKPFVAMLMPSTRLAHAFAFLEKLILPHCCCLLPTHDLVIHPESEECTSK